MKNILFVTAKSLEEAKEKASQELNMPVEWLSIEKLDESEIDVLEGATPLEARFKVQPKLDIIQDIAYQNLLQLLNTMNINARVKNSIVGNLIHLTIMSKEKKLISGKKGSTLEAISHFVNRIVNRGDKNLPYILIDLEGFNDRRYHRIKREAMRAIEFVRKHNQKFVMRSMKPEDRKIIHNIIRGTDGVFSFSQGQDRERSVVVTSEQSNNSRNNPELTGGFF